MKEKLRNRGRVIGIGRQRGKENIHLGSEGFTVGKL